MSLRHHQITLELELPTRTADVPLVITVQEGSGAQNSSSGRCGAMLLHGAGGDVHSGHLPAFAAALAGVGVACVVRYTARGPLASRVAVCKVRGSCSGVCAICLACRKMANMVAPPFCRRCWRSYLGGASTAGV